MSSLGDREAQIGRPHHLSTRDRRAVGALLLFFGALLVIALAMMMLGPRSAD
jgi:hypothetical protein